MVINGEDVVMPENITVEEMLNKLNLNKDKVVVEVNLEILRKDEYLQKRLNSNSKVEIIRFVGGG